MNISHKDIWRGIDRLAARGGHTASGLARLAGMDPTSFNKSKRKNPDGRPRWPSMETLARVLSVTDTSLTEFAAIVEDGE